MKPETVLIVARSSGDLAGAFEFDGETCYFYLYRPGESARIVDAIHILSRPPDFGRQELDVRWYACERKVGLFIRNELWAAFDCDAGAKYGGNYRPGRRPALPRYALQGLGPKGLDA